MAPTSRPQGSRRRPPLGVGDVHGRVSRLWALDTGDDSAGLLLMQRRQGLQPGLLLGLGPLTTGLGEDVLDGGLQRRTVLGVVDLVLLDLHLALDLGPVDILLVGHGAVRAGGEAPHALLDRGLLLAAAVAGADAGRDRRLAHLLLRHHVQLRGRVGYGGDVLHGGVCHGGGIHRGKGEGKHGMEGRALGETCEPLGRPGGLLNR